MSDVVEKLLNSAVEALHTGNHTVCMSLTSQALQELAPGDRRIPEALSLRGTARLRFDPAAALEDLQQAVQLDPKEPQFKTALGQAFVSLGRLDEAKAALGQAWQLSKGHPVVTDLLARVLLQKGEAFQAVQLLGPLVQSGRAKTSHIRQFAEALYHSGDIYGARDVLLQLYGPSGPQTATDRLQLARIEMALRDYEAADTHLKALLKEEPDHVSALMSSVRLMDWLGDQDKQNEYVKRLGFHADGNPEALSIIVDHSAHLPSERLAAFTRLVTDTPVMTEEIAVLGFSLALYFDRRKEFDRAFEIASSTNERLAASRGAVQTADAIQASYQKTLRHIKNAGRLYREVQPVPKTADSPDCIYLIGAPRTGSSLIQSVLAAPEGIKSVGERGALFPYLNDAVERDIEEGAFRRLIAELAVADVAGLKRFGPVQKRYIDKTPHNLYVAGLLQKINPEAQFVKVFRDAGDVALSMFLRPFSSFFPEATSLDSLRASLRTRLDVFEFWAAEGLQIHPFSYEAFTEAPGEQGQKLFGLVGQEWNDAYLDPALRPDAIPTFSSRQVRQCIQAKTSPHWQSYREFAPDVFDHLGEITAAQNAITNTKV